MRASPYFEVTALCHKLYTCAMMTAAFHASFATFSEYIDIKRSSATRGRQILCAGHPSKRFCFLAMYSTWQSAGASQTFTSANGINTLIDSFNVRVCIPSVSFFTGLFAGSLIGGGLPPYLTADARMGIMGLFTAIKSIPGVLIEKFEAESGAVVLAFDCNVLLYQAVSLVGQYVVALLWLHSFHG